MDKINWSKIIYIIVTGILIISLIVLDILFVEFIPLITITISFVIIIMYFPLLGKENPNQRTFQDFQNNYFENRENLNNEIQANKKESDEINN